MRRWKDAKDEFIPKVKMEVIKVGDKIFFTEEKQGYTVQARNDEFIICTKPFNLQKTVIYTILDLKQGLRNRDNKIFCAGYETRELCEDRLSELEDDELHISKRRPMKINIEEVRVK